MAATPHSVAARRADLEAHFSAIERYLSKAEIAWHERLIAELPDIIEDERGRYQEKSQ